MIGNIIGLLIIYLVIGWGYASFITIKYKKDVKSVDEAEAIKRFCILMVGFPFFMVLDFLEFWLKVLTK
jgi:Ca2+/Na+ antiporter